jgi:AraC-like DNA-binding protein
MPSYSGVDLFTETLGWAQSHLDEPMAIDDLATRSAMSSRTFARRFAETTGTTPYRWLLQQRIQRAQRWLETTDLSIDMIATRSGVDTADNLRKHFHRAVHTSPNSYRRTFAAPNRDRSEKTANVSSRAWSTPRPFHRPGCAPTFEIPVVSMVPPDRGSLATRAPADHGRQCVRSSGRPGRSG